MMCSFRNNMKSINLLFVLLALPWSSYLRVQIITVDSFQSSNILHPRSSRSQQTIKSESKTRTMKASQRISYLSLLPNSSSSSYLEARTQNHIIQHLNSHHNIHSSLSSSSDDFIDYILSPPSDDPSFRCTHMIGIPLEQNHDLLLELESIQRAVLYHCPFLIHACIAPIVTRMPLLLIDTNPGGSSSGGGSSSRGGIDFNTMFNRKSPADVVGPNGDLSPSAPGENDLLTSRDPITRTIHDIVNSVVDEMINVQTVQEKCEQDDYKSVNGENNDVQKDDDDDDRDGVNRDNIKPLLLKFKGLEIDGDLNEVLHAVGTEESGTIQLRNVLNEITKRLEQKGWKTYIPEDNPQGKVGGLDEDGITWRPRIPFMRLPNDFFETLPDPTELWNGKKWDDCSEEERLNHIRLPDEGGNGISPLFWFKWMDDPLCNGKSIRIRELAVYGRTGPMGMTEQAFYIPHLRTRLPDGNAKLQEDERKDREYDNERRLEQEMIIDGSSQMNIDDVFSSSSEIQFEKEMATYKSNADRQLLQTIFDSSPDENSNSVKLDDGIDIEAILSESLRDIVDKDDDTKTERKKEIAEIKSEEKVLDQSKDKLNTEVGKNPRKDREAEIIQSIAKPMATGDWSKFKKKKDKPRPEDNPILRDWKERVSKNPNVIDVQSEERKPLPPFPSDEYFVGIWKLESTPGGKVIDEEKMLIDPNQSENLVLRVDGTIGGGPMLDPENLHRAAGGTWKYFQAQWVGPGAKESAEDSLTTRLRIRLIIPPKKERVLVFEGEVKRGTFASPESVSQENMNELRKSSFANQFGKKEEYGSINSDSLFMQCSGEMWTENVHGNKNRSKVGKFTMSKREQRETNYQYSIPAPQRYQD